MSFRSWLSLAAVVPLVLCAFGSAQAELTPEQKTAFRPIVEAALGNEQKDVRHVAILALGAMLVDKVELKDFRKYLDDADEVIKNGALVALARRADKDSLADLEKRLGAVAEAELDASFSTLVGPLPQDVQRSFLEKLLKKPKTEALRLAVYRFLAREASDEVFELAKGLGAIKDVAVREAVLDVLIAQPRPAALAIAQELAGAKEASVRLRALKLARALNSRDGLDLVVKGMQDADESVRVYAEAEAMAAKHPAVVPLLEAKLAENPSDFETMKLLLGHETSNLVELLTPIVAKENPSLELPDYISALSLVAAANTDEARAILDKKLASTFQKDRTAAACALGYTRDKRYTSQLASLVVDGAVEIRRCAAASYGLLADPTGLDTMSRALSSEADTETKLALIRSLGQIGDASAVNSLQLMVLDSNNEIRKGALDALAALKSLQASGAIELVAEDSDPEMRWRAVVALFLIDPVVYGERLKKAVADAPEAAFFATLERLDADMRTKLLEEVLRSSRSALALRIVNDYAAQGAAGLDMLRKAFDWSSDADVRGPAFLAIVTHRDSADLERCKTMLADKDRKLRFVALTTLLGFPREQTESTLVELAKSDDPLFQVTAIYGLVK